MPQVLSPNSDTTFNLVMTCLTRKKEIKIPPPCQTSPVEFLRCALLRGNPPSPESSSGSGNDDPRQQAVVQQYIASGDLRHRERGAWGSFRAPADYHGERSCESAPGRRRLPRRPGCP